jgi:hypothetical protein
VAAGCTPDINEADYQDFTGYFMGALSGRDRLGNAVNGADYDGDGRVSMDEAFCYALIHDPTIDVPVCTSDAFVRDREPLSDDQVFQTRFTRVRSWATPAQRAALDALAAGEKAQPGVSLAADQGSQPPDIDLARLCRQITTGGPTARRAAEMRAMWRAQSAYDSLHETLRSRLLNRWPALKSPDDPGYERARQEAIEYLSESGAIDRLDKASTAVDRAASSMEDEEVALSRRLRLMRLAKTVVLTHLLENHGDRQDRKDLVRILQAEHRSLFPSAG